MHFTTLTFAGYLGLAACAAVPPNPVLEAEALEVPEAGTSPTWVDQLFKRDDDLPICSWNQEIDCDGKRSSALRKYGTDFDICAKGIGSLYGPTEQNAPIPESPRNYCFESGNEKCCISWSQPAPPGTSWHTLLIAGNTVNKECRNRLGQNKISGQVHKVNLGGRCMSVCVSNREKGCTN